MYSSVLSSIGLLLGSAVGYLTVTHAGWLFLRYGTCYHATMMLASDVEKALMAEASDHDATNLAWFFKTGVGEYGEGDIFIGVRVRNIRKISKTFAALSLIEASKLVTSPIHEIRMTGLIIIANRAKKASGDELNEYYNFYLDHLHRGYINNWDLVDVTCRDIVGRYLIDKDRTPLYKLAKSKLLWERRVAIVSTSAFINRGQSTDTLALAELLLHDNHDLIHKATGWMLREVGKRCSQALLTDWLDEHVLQMPRTMLRYAIEQLPDPTRLQYLRMK